LRLVENRLRLLMVLTLLGSFALFSWRGLGEAFRERGRYTDALGLVPAATTPLSFAVPSLSELAVRYNLEPSRASCTLCHLGKETSGVFNPFGRDYQDKIQHLLDEVVSSDSPETRSIFQLNPRQIRHAVAQATLDGLDSDGDRYDNDLELLFGFLPGDAQSRPSLSVETMQKYRTQLRQVAEEGRLETLLRMGVQVRNDDLKFWGFTGDQTPTVRLERLALYRAALSQY
jgi:hypothetical protein